MRRLVLGAVLAVLVALGGVATAAPEKSKVTIAVGGKAALYYRQP